MKNKLIESAQKRLVLLRDDIRHAENSGFQIERHLKSIEFNRIYRILIYLQQK